jgi:hypothetical protein
MTDTASGRPIRCLALFALGWIAVRIGSVHGDRIGLNAEADMPPPSPIANSQGARSVPHWASAPPAPAQTPTPVPRITRQGFAPARSASLFVRTAQVNFAPKSLASAIRAALTQPSTAPMPIPPPEARLSPVTSPVSPPLSQPPSMGRDTDRWRASAWLFWRDGAATPSDTLPGGRLGGSQVGLRVDFDLTPQAFGRLASYARASAALNRPSAPEAALGLAWQPTRAIPISIAAERRIALGQDARNAAALLVVGGFGPTLIGASLEAEAYAQSGMVGFRSRDLFVDGKMSLLSPLKGTPVKIGASLSGGAQPQVERLDIGPEMQIRLPLPKVPARLGIEWRERVAGRAAPTSGLTMTLGADF